MDDLDEFLNKVGKKTQESDHNAECLECGTSFNERKRGPGRKCECGCYRFKRWDYKCLLCNKKFYAKESFKKMRCPHCDEMIYSAPCGKDMEKIAMENWDNLPEERRLEIKAAQEEASNRKLVATISRWVKNRPQFLEKYTKANLDSGNKYYKKVTIVPKKNIDEDNGGGSTD